MIKVLYTLKAVNEALRKCLSDCILTDIEIQEDSSYKLCFQPTNIAKQADEPVTCTFLTLDCPWTIGGSELEHRQFVLRDRPDEYYGIRPTEEEISGLLKLKGEKLLRAIAKEDGTLRMEFAENLWFVAEVEPRNYLNSCHSWSVSQVPDEAASTTILGGLHPEVQLVDKVDQIQI